MLDPLRTTAKKQLQIHASKNSRATIILAKFKSPSVLKGKFTELTVILGLTHAIFEAAVFERRKRCCVLNAKPYLPFYNCRKVISNKTLN